MIRKLIKKALRPLVKELLQEEIKISKEEIRAILIDATETIGRGL